MRETAHFQKIAPVWFVEGIIAKRREARIRFRSFSLTNDVMLQVRAVCFAVITHFHTKLLTLCYKQKSIDSQK